MLVYYFVPFIASNRYLLFWVSNGRNSVTVQNRTHVYMNFFDHKDLGNHLLQLCPKVVKRPVYHFSRTHLLLVVFSLKSMCPNTDQGISVEIFLWLFCIAMPDKCTVNCPAGTVAQRIQSIHIMVNLWLLFAIFLWIHPHFLSCRCYLTGSVCYRGDTRSGQDTG